MFSTGIVRTREEYPDKTVFKERCDSETPLYTAAPPAVLPPEIDDIWDAIHMPCMATSNLDERECCVARDAYNQCRADALALGAQQKKVVELHKRKSTEVINGQRHSYVLLEDLLPELDAANVKWEVKK